MRFNLSIALLLMVFVMNAQVPTNGLVAYYPFNGNANDESGNGHNGTQVNTSLSTDRFGAAEKAILFNGTDAYINLGSNFDFHESFSVSFYAKTLSNTGANPSLLAQGIQDFNKGLHLMLGNSYFRFDFWGVNPLDCNANFPLVNQWAFWTFTYDAATNSRKIHLNGNLICSDNPSSDCLSVGDVLLGRVTFDNPLNVHYHGVMDEVRIYNRALTDQEVDQLFQAGAPPADITTGLVVHSPFDGNANDVSGNGNNSASNIPFTKDRFGENNKAINTTNNDVVISSNQNLSLANQSISISGWVNPNETWSSENRGAILCKGGYEWWDGYELLVRGDLRIEMVINRSYFLTDKAISLNKWSHIVGTFNNETKEIAVFIDGVKQTGSLIQWGDIVINPSTEDVIIGQRNPASTYTNRLLGGVDDVRVYNRALYVIDVAALYGNYVSPIKTYPQITIDKANLSTGENLNINGQNFTPNSTAKIHFTGAGGDYFENIAVGNAGNFTFTYNIPNSSRNGLVYFDAINSGGSNELISRTFQLNIPIVQTPNNINILNPINTVSYPINSLINIQWQDRILGGSIYPMIPNTGERVNKYIVEYQKDGGAWESITTIEGSYSLNRLILHTTTFTPTSLGKYRFRISDFFDVTRFKETEDVDVLVAAEGNLVKTAMLWDKSYPPNERYKNPEGVAADGTARVYLKIFKTALAINTKILNVSIRLEDNKNIDSKYLGKVMVATNFENYDLEANNASETFISDNSSGKNEYIFWYVAPDNFVGNDPLDSAKRMRVVNAIITVNYDNATTTVITRNIRIVRPPLMMVHGLGGDNETWKGFNFSYEGFHYTSDYLKMFAHVAFVKMNKHSHFETNATALLSETETNGIDLNSKFHGVINDIRNKGYAANQVDYVCHSMGGNVLRTAVSDFSDLFYGKNQFANRIYKNYQKGFVHKAITVNTPHNGSPWGDVIDYGIGPAINPKFLPKIWTLLNGWHLIGPAYPPFDHIEPKGIIFQATEAVKDFRLLGGKRHPKTNIPIHLIGGEVISYENLAEALVLFSPKFADFFNTSLDIQINSSKNGVLNELLAIKQIPDKMERAFKYIEYQGKYINPTSTNTSVISNGDFVVALKSQLAGGENTNRTILKGLGYNHIGVKDKEGTGNRIFQLLNSDVKGELFSPGIQAQNRIQPSQRPLNSTNSDFFITSNYLRDTTKIIITSPNNGSTYLVDSIINVNVVVKDTVGLLFTQITFQGNSFESFSKARDLSFSIPVNPDYLDSQTIIAESYYSINDSTNLVVYDSIIVSIQNNGQLVGFQAEPEIMELTVGESQFPQLKSIYTTSISALKVNDTSLTVQLLNPGVVTYEESTGIFKGNSTGSTIAIVSYKGFIDTMYISVTSDSVALNLSSNCINKSISGGLWSSPTTWSKGLIPSYCDSVVIEQGHLIKMDTSTQIKALYISQNSSITIDSSKYKMIIDNLKGANSSFEIKGAMNLTEGAIEVNGKVKFYSGSSLKISGGLLSIKGNTGNTNTSVENGVHLFEAIQGMTSFNFSGGTLQIIDPPLGAASQAISCLYNFGDGSTLKLGDGISTTTSNNPHGFGGNLLPAQIGKFIMDTKTLTGNRHFINLKPLSIKSPVNVNSGNLIQSARLTIRQ